MNIAHDLFLLMFNLSQLRDKENIIVLFIDGMNEAFSTVYFRLIDKTYQSQENDMDIRTRKSFFGYIRVEPYDKLSKSDLSLVQNAVQMLAVILERLELEDLLKREKGAIEKIANERYLDLNFTIRELGEARKAAFNLVEDLTIEVEKRKQSEQEITKLNNELEQKVAEKTRELTLRIAELERFHEATIEREFRIKELRDEINQLKNQSV